MLLREDTAGSLGVGLFSLLFSFNGRINRLQYWAGTLGVSVGAVLLIFFLALLTGAAAPIDKQAGLQGAALLLLIIGLTGILSGWAGLALQVKRFHDRGQPGWLALLPILPMMGLMTAIVGGVTSGQTAAELAPSLQVYVLALWAINLFFFVNLGCLAGTAGPNKYGDPPGGPRSPAPSFNTPSAPVSAGGLSFLGNAEKAMDRALAEKAMARAAAPAPRQPVPAAAPRATPSFGRRATR